MREFSIDITPYEHRIKQSLGKFEGKDVRDYGLINTYDMAMYACVDTLCVQFLKNNLKINDSVRKVVELETALLPLLFQIEQVGIKLDIPKVASDWQRIIPHQTKRIKRLKNLTGLHDFDPHKKKSLKELFCEKLQWELDYTAKSIEKYEKGEITEGERTVSFGYASIMKHMKEFPKLTSTWIKYQEEEKIKNSFAIPYLEKHVSEASLIHSTFNQIVRTGRMSNSNPAMQQLPARVKEYIVPYTDEYVLVEFDLSQIEFRVIVHYIKNKRCIQDYNENPDTDFHQWVAKMCNIPRDPAKNINFMLGYGGGREKCVSMLSELPEIIGELSYRDAITVRANSVYDAYHAALPELKKTQWRASDVLRDRGYVRTLLGRERHLPKKLHFKAFNSVCQGSAADIQKWLTNYRIKKFIGMDCILHLLVHDSWIFSIKKNRVEELIPAIKEAIETPIPDIKLSVPIRSDVILSDKNWRACKDETKAVKKFLKMFSPEKLEN